MSNGKFIDFYAILGIARTATPKEIKAAYRDMCKKWHPDRCQDPKAEDMMKLINQAWDTLRDDDRRRKYNMIYDIYAEVRTRRQKEAEEQARREREQQERKRREEEERTRRQREEEARARKEAEDRARRKKEAEERRRREEEERRRREEEERRRRQREEEERLRKEAEERARREREEQERKRQMEILAAVERLLKNPNVLTASRTLLRKGKRENAMLAWDLSDVARYMFRARIYADDGNRFDITEAKGGMSVSPVGTTTYKMEIYVEGVFVGSRQKTINVQPEAEVNFTSEFSHVLRGTNVRLTWDVKGARSVEIEGFGSQPAKDAMEVRIDRDTTFRLKADDAFGGRTATVSIMVMPRAIATGVRAPQPGVTLRTPNPIRRPTPLNKTVELKAPTPAINTPGADAGKATWRTLDFGQALEQALEAGLAKVRETLKQNNN